MDRAFAVDDAKRIIKLKHLAGMIEARPLSWDSEEELQERLHDGLLGELGFEREVRAGSSRFDFYSARDRLVVEVKVKGTPAAVLAQLLRYAELDDVDGILLATSRSKLARQVPDTLCGKPVAVARLWLWAFLR